MCRYECRTGLTEWSGTRYGCTGTGTGTDLGAYTGGVCTERIRYVTAAPAWVVLSLYDMLFKRYPLDYQLKKRKEKNGGSP